jgi:Transcription termination factor nusG
MATMSALAAPENPLPSPTTNDERHWFAISTRQHHEKHVAQYLADREIEHFLPLYRTVHQWTHYRKVILELPLFPGYLFVRIAPTPGRPRPDWLRQYAHPDSRLRN